MKLLYTYIANCSQTKCGKSKAFSQIIGQNLIPNPVKRRLILWRKNIIKKNNPKVIEEYSLPDGRKVTVCRDVDRYYGLKLDTTKGRRHRGWSIEECSSNHCVKKGPSVVIELDELEILDKRMGCAGVFSMEMESWLES